MLPYQFLAEMRLYIVMTLHLVLLLDRMHEVRAYLVVGPHAFRRGSAFQPFFSPKRSIRLAGMQYTGSTSSSPG
jgi:hypothetical protein